MDYKKAFGKTGTDVVTGFEGVITGYIEYVYGCEQYLLIPKAKDNKRGEGEWFDVARIKISGKAIKLQSVPGVKGAEFPTEKLPGE